jgi:hypothetical protein
MAWGLLEVARVRHEASVTTFAAVELSKELEIESWVFSMR